ncbi:MAG: hypothetical protein ALAOOOJD_04532 [bacterium]|nr:hypothetical protein [bacterium]
MPKFLSGEKLMRQSMKLRAVAGASDQNAFRWADHQAAGLQKKLLACFPLQRRPIFVGALHDRHVHRMFEIRLANDARLAVRRAEGVRRRETIQS